MKGRRHVLLDILVIAVLAALCGIDDWEGTVDFAKRQEGWLRTFLALPNGIPSHDTFNRVFRLLAPRAFSEAFLKSNEIKVIPELLKVLDLRGCIVTIDAMGCQKAIVEEIVARKANYVLTVKANQERLFEALQASFAHLGAEPSAFPHFFTESQEEAHGRSEFRRVTSLDGVRHLPEDILFSWSRLETLMRIQSVTQRGDKTEREERFYSSSMPMRRAETTATCPRAHWGIENRLHWTLDVAFREDGNRNRKGNVAECGAVLRHVVLNLLRRDPNPEKRSIRRRRLKAALAPDNRLVALLGFPTCCQPGVPARPKTYIAIKDTKFPIHPLLLG